MSASVYLHSPHVEEVLDRGSYHVLPIAHNGSDEIDVRLFFQGGRGQVLAYVATILSVLGVNEFHWHEPVEHDSAECENPECPYSGTTIPAQFTALVDEGAKIVFTDVIYAPETHELKPFVVEESTAPTVTTLHIVN